MRAGIKCGACVLATILWFEITIVRRNLHPMKPSASNSSRLLAAALLLVLASCSSQKETIPTAKDLDRYIAQQRAIMQPQITEMENRKARGEMSEAEYKEQKAAMEDLIAKRATNSAWTNHQLAENERMLLGLPTPGNFSPVPLQQGGSAGGSFYQPRGQVGGNVGGLDNNASGLIGGGSNGGYVPTASSLGMRQTGAY